MGAEGFRVVGIGASAGGVEALRELLPSLPDGQVAYVVAQHMSPVHPSLLMQVLARETSLRVAEIVNGVLIEPGVVYVAPPNCDIEIVGNRLMARQAAPRISPQPSIDILLESIAASAGVNGIAVILSGTGSDGVAGVEAVRAAGGRTIAQDPASARYRDMPTASIDGGAVEYVLAPAEIGNVLGSILRGEEGPPSRGRWADDTAMAALARETRRITGWDLVSYKDGTLGRQLSKRMSLLRLDSLEAYLDYAVDNPEELELLRDSMLIKVTGFMRDRRSFDALRDALEPRVAAKAPGEPLRAWVAGCATGEEAYSIAMMLTEAVRRRGGDLPIKVFATDISEAGMEVARRGSYPLSALRDLPDEWRDRYFDIDGDQAQVVKGLREMLVIARQDVTRDPPLVRMDLVSCRNLLIYLVPSVQQRVLANFHASLNPRGLLFLGRSESVPADGELFSAVSANDKLYTRGSSTSTVVLGSPVRDTRVPPGQPPRELALRALRDVLRDEIRDRLLSEYGPPSLLVDAAGTPVHQVGDVARFLRLPDGSGDYTLPDMILPSLRTEVSTMLARVAREGTGSMGHTVVVEHADGSFETLRLHVSRVLRAGMAEPFALVSFVPQPAVETAERAAGGALDGSARRGDDTVEELLGQVLGLENALAGTREHLQAVIEELESSNEELQAMNEELQASSEELQATNEELETTNEELQATNEELTTVNETLEVRTSELSETNVILQNIQDSVHTAIVLVDAEQRVQRFSPLAVKIFGLVRSDVGTKLSHLPSHVDVSDLSEVIDRVLATGEGHVAEVSSTTATYLLQVMPYREDDTVRGAVLALSDVTELNRARRELAGRAEEFRVLSEAVPHMVYRTSLDMTAPTYVSPSVEEIYGVRADEVLADVATLAARVHPDDVPHLHAAITANPTADHQFDYRVVGADGAIRHVRDISQVVSDPETEALSRVGTAIDITDLRLAVIRAEQERARAEGIYSRSGVPMAITDPDGRITAANVPMCRLLGRLESDLVGMCLADLVDDGDRAAVIAGVVGAVTAPDGHVEFPVRLTRPDGSVVHADQHIASIGLPASDVGAEERFIFTSLHDTTAAELARRAAKVREDRFAAVFTRTGAPMVIEGADGRVLECNAALCSMLGYAADDVIGRRLADFTHPEDIGLDLLLLGEVARGARDSYAIEKRFVARDGSIVWGRVLVSAIPALGPTQEHLYIKTVLDITGERDREAAALRLSQLDALTGLANRGLAFDRLHQAVLRARRNGEQVSVLFVDLDGFKAVNDRWGHEIGDLVLRTVAERLRALTRESDSVARMGGDEFVIVAPHDTGESPNEGLRLADELLHVLARPMRTYDTARPGSTLAQRALEGVRAGIDLPEGTTLSLTASIGLAQYPADSDDVEDLVRKADLAMYAAKGRGGNQVRFYAERLHDHARARAEARSDFAAGLDRAEIVPYYQPVLDVATGSLVAVEVLARWVHPQRGVLAPIDFLDIAQEAGLLDGMTQRLVASVVVDLPRLRSIERDVSVAINISPEQLLGWEFVDGLCRLTPDGLHGWTVEVTESAALGSDGVMTDALKRLREAGARTALDDFGTGYSSVLHLKSFGFDEVKIDREFVSGPAGPDRTLITAMVGMAHGLDAITVAEGVETPDQADVLRDLRVDRMQGYLLSRPLPVDRLLDWMERRS